MDEPKKSEGMNPVARVAVFIAIKLVALSVLTLVILRWKGLI